METAVADIVFQRFFRELEEAEGDWGRLVADVLRGAREEGRIRPADLLDTFRRLGGDDA